MSAPEELPFTDLVLGQDYCDAKLQEPQAIRLVNLQEQHAHWVAKLRGLCSLQSSNEAEFTVELDNFRFRVTTLEQQCSRVWFLSRIDAQVRPINQLPLPAEFVRFSLRPQLQGLILVTGGFGTGKTTTASSLFCHRIAQLGGTGIALEDPTGEVQMAGRHGLGRIVQIPVSRSRGGYHAGLQLVRRSRADYVLVGEIRDASTAIDAQDIGNTDMPVIATMHASSIEEAFDKYQAYLRKDHASTEEANARLAMSICAVVHLSKQFSRASDGSTITRFVPRCLILDRTDPSCTAIIGKIRDGNFIGLNDDIAFQATRRFGMTVPY